ncbi:MAG: hypothetical protein ACR2OA_11510 [Rubripirellula sp.]
MNRGFDEYYKFMGRGGHSYFDLRSDSDGKFAHPIYRNKQHINDEGYLKNRLTEEAVDFIERNKTRPFFSTWPTTQFMRQQKLLLLTFSLPRIQIQALRLNGPL